MTYIRELELQAGDQSEATQLAAVKFNWENIKYCKNPSEKVQLAYLEGLKMVKPSQS